MKVAELSSGCSSSSAVALLQRGPDELGGIHADNARGENRAVFDNNGSDYRDGGDCEEGG